MAIFAQFSTFLLHLISVLKIPKILSKYWIIFKCGWDYILNRKDFENALLEICEKVGPICRLNLGFLANILLTDPKDINVVLSHCLDRTDKVKWFTPFLGNGIISAEKEEWKMKRKVANVAFGQKVLNMYFPICQKYSQRLVSELRNLDPTEFVDVKGLFNACYLGISSECFLGVDLSVGTKSDNITDLVQELRTYYSKRYAFPLYSYNFFWNLTTNAKLFTNLEARVAADIENALAERKDTPFLSHVEKDEVKNGYTHQDLIDEIKTILVTGTETPSTVLSSILVLLALYPDHQQRIYNELMELSENGDFTLDDLHKMLILESFIKENLRLFPIQLIMVRVCDKDLVLDSGTIPKGYKVIVPVYYLHMNPKVWDNPKDFDPSRFQGADTEEMKKHYMPFSTRPRNCIGWKFAMMSMKLVLANVITNFEIVACEYKSINDIKLEFNAIMTAKMGYKVKIVPRGHN